jgi:hypothetical protein
VGRIISDVEHFRDYKLALRARLKKALQRPWSEFKTDKRVNMAIDILGTEDVLTMADKRKLLKLARKLYRVKKSK